MANTALSDAEIQAMALGDVSLVSIEWKGENAPNLLIVLRRTTVSASLLFTWVNDLHINLDLRRSFSAFTWEVEFSRNTDGRWHVLFDFAHDGEIQFACQDIISDPEQVKDISR